MTEIPGKYRVQKAQKYENLPITTLGRLSHIGMSTIYHSNHELNYSLVAFSHVICNLDHFSPYPSTQPNTLVVAVEQIQPWGKTSARIQKCKTSEAQKIKNSHTLTSLATTTYAGAV